jgi:hypothetical protein
MSKREIYIRTLDIFSNIWWKYVPGTIITVKWPVGWAVVDDDGQGGQTSVESADPNDHFRPWLEKNVGRQKWDWDWRLGDIAARNFDGSVVGFDTVKIKFRKSKARFATIAALRWGT